MIKYWNEKEKKIMTKAEMEAITVGDKQVEAPVEQAEVSEDADDVETAEAPVEQEEKPKRSRK